MNRQNRGRSPVFVVVVVCGITLAAAILGMAVWNLDVVLRLFRKYQSGTLNTRQIGFDLAAFDLGASRIPAIYDSKISAADQMKQVLVPQGAFLMGDAEHPESKEFPQHKVYLDGFWIDQIPVTNSMYARCLKAGACSEPALRYNTYFGRWAYRDYPVVYVTWPQARAYCTWAGRRLPTEAEYEKAARGIDARHYPWGNHTPTPELANFGGQVGETVSAYRYVLGASPYGALGMVGNVREWVWDWFDPKYYRRSPYVNPKGPTTGTQRSLRSGSFNESALEIEVFWRYAHEPLSAGLSRGFRCAQDAALLN